MERSGGVVRNSYKDYDGNIVTVGDSIRHVNLFDGTDGEFAGKVVSIRQHGKYIHPETDRSTKVIWGKYTRKIIYQ